MAISAMEAAKIACQESEWELSNLQLQKILYIASMSYAGSTEGKDTLIGDEYFQAWKYGPVLPDVYQSAYQFGSGPIEKLPGSQTSSIPPWTPEYKEIQRAVQKLKDKPVFELVEFTHSEIGAWHDAYNSGYNMPIFPEDIYSEYKMRMGIH